MQYQVTLPANAVFQIVPDTAGNNVLIVTGIDTLPYWVPVSPSVPIQTPVPTQPRIIIRKFTRDAQSCEVIGDPDPDTTLQSVNPALYIEFVEVNPEGVATDYQLNEGEASNFLNYLPSIIGAITREERTDGGGFIIYTPKTATNPREAISLARQLYYREWNGLRLITGVVDCF